MASHRDDAVPMATLQGPYVEENPFEHHNDYYDSDHDRNQLGRTLSRDEQQYHLQQPFQQPLQQQEQRWPQQQPQQRPRQQSPQQPPQQQQPQQQQPQQQQHQEQHQEHEVISHTSHERPRSFIKGEYAPFRDQPQEPLGRPYHGPLYHFKAWSPEIVWCILTLGVFIGLVVLLAEHNGKPIPEWPLGLTINTVVALLATMCRFMTFIPIAEGISQLKWNWFTSNTRPLKDLYTFDQASRGPWGALILITKLRGRFISLGTMASFVMVSGLVTSFLTQSAIAYSTRQVASTSDGAIARAAKGYPYGMIETGLDQQDVIDGISSAAFQAAFYTTDKEWPQVEPVCPSANCTWPLYNTLAVCVSIGNITDRLTVRETDPDRSWGERQFNASLPNGMGYVFEKWAEDPSGKSVPRRHANMTSPPAPDDFSSSLGRRSNNTFELPDLEDLPPWPEKRNTLYDWENPDVLSTTFSQFTFVYNMMDTDPEDKDHRFRAFEVLWHFCVDTYNVTVTEGVLKSERVRSSVELDKVNRWVEHGMDSYTIAAEGVDGQKESFNVSSSWAYTRLDLDFRDTLGGAWSDMWGTGAYTEFSFRLGRNLYRGTESNMTVVDADDKMWKNLQSITGTIANSMTSYMQTTEANSHVQGAFLTTETFITVRWGWLAFLATQIGLTYIFLIVVVVHTARLDVEIVKSSNIAELFAMRGATGVDENNGNSAPAASHTPQWMGFQPKVDGKLNGRLRKDGENGWNLDLLRGHDGGSRPGPPGG